MTHRVVTPIPIQTTGTEFITCFELLVLNFSFGRTMPSLYAIQYIDISF